jgi:hypothetical protein
MHLVYRRVGVNQATRIHPLSFAQDQIQALSTNQPNKPQQNVLWRCETRRALLRACVYTGSPVFAEQPPQRLWFRGERERERARVPAKPTRCTFHRFIIFSRSPSWRPQVVRPSLPPWAPFSKQGHIFAITQQPKQKQKNKTNGTIILV